MESRRALDPGPAARPTSAAVRARPARRLRIGVDATSLASGRGYGRFAREILPPLLASEGDHEYVLFVDAWSAEEADLPGLLSRVPSARVTTVLLEASESQARAASARGSRSPLDLLRMGRAVAGLDLQVVWFPTVYSYFPVPSRVPVVVAFHDVIPERYGAVVFPTRRTRWLWRAKTALARRQARLVLTVSDWSRRALHETLGIPLEKIRVTSEAPSAAFRPPDPRDAAACRSAWLAGRGIPGDAPYFVYVGGFNPHKNLERLVRALAGLAGAAAPHLLLVGDHERDVFHIDVEGLRRASAAAGLAGRVHFTGFVPDEALVPLLAGARALVLPSLEEGFGLPAVEAAAVGAPCIATRRSPLPELLEGGGLFVEPTDETALGGAMARLLDDDALRARLAARARERAAALTWEAAAARAHDALLEAAR
ncbi:MAG TPA: glycosyltransferase family 1 protein [Myxococcota bacterium]|jgi:glycosyltransferase involved in cell wall biosynthesis|nr:glycosyltransferase family 1 protein [Myxococcota bacterium]